MRRLKTCRSCDPDAPRGVDYTPVMISRAKEVARAFVKSPVVIQGVRKAKKGAGDVAKGLLQELGEGGVEETRQKRFEQAKESENTRAQAFAQGHVAYHNKPYSNSS